MRATLAAEPGLVDALCEPAAPLVLAPLVTPPLSPDQAAGLDLILEGFLLHHGSPRHLRALPHGRRVLAGDYCYAHGLVRVAEAGDLAVILALSELISVSAGLVAQRRHGALLPLWRATIAVIAARVDPTDPLPEAFVQAQTRLRTADPEPLAQLAASLPATPELQAGLTP